MQNVISADEAGQLSRQDAEHLRLLSIFYYVMAGLGVLGLLMMGVGLFAGFGFMAQAEGPNGPPKEFFAFFGVVVLMAAVFSLATILLNFFAGRALAAKKSRTLILVVAALNCLSVPLGTALGIFTFIVMLREPVSREFEKR